MYSALLLAGTVHDGSALRPLQKWDVKVQVAKIKCLYLQTAHATGASMPPNPAGLRISVLTEKGSDHPR